MLVSVNGQSVRISNGQNLYQALCSSCHGINPQANRNKIMSGISAESTLSAISENRGGMGVLLSQVSETQIEDISLYLKSRVW